MASPAEAPGTAGSQFFVVTETMPAPPRVCNRQQGDGRNRNGREDRSARRRIRTAEASRWTSRASRSGKPSGDGRRGRPRSRRGVAAGSPKQRLLLPRVLERLAATPIDEIVIVAGAYELEAPSDRRTRACPSLVPGPGNRNRMRFAAGSRRSAPSVEAAVVVLADDPNLSPGCDRTRALRHGRGQTSFPPPTTGSEDTRSSWGVLIGRHSRRGAAGSAARPSPATTSVRRATSIRWKTCELSRPWRRAREARRASP